MGAQEASRAVPVPGAMAGQGTWAAMVGLPSSHGPNHPLCLYGRSPTTPPKKILGESRGSIRLACRRSGLLGCSGSAGSSWRTGSAGSRGHSGSVVSRGCSSSVGSWGHSGTQALGGALEARALGGPLEVQALGGTLEARMPGGALEARTGADSRVDSMSS